MYNTQCNFDSFLSQLLEIQAIWRCQSSSSCFDSSSQVHSASATQTKIQNENLLWWRYCHIDVHLFFPLFVCRCLFIRIDLSLWLYLCDHSKMETTIYKTEDATLTYHHWKWPLILIWIARFIRVRRKWCGHFDHSFSLCIACGLMWSISHHFVTTKFVSLCEMDRTLFFLRLCEWNEACDFLRNWDTCRPHSEVQLLDQNHTSSWISVMPCINL